MATPTFRAAGTWSFTANNVASPFTTNPGAPTGKASGDLLVLICESRSITATVATPTGWTLVSGFPKRSGTSSGGTIYVFTRIADGSATDTPSPVWTGQTTGTSGDACGAGILAYSVGTATLDGTVTVSDLSAQTTTTTIPTLTTTLPETLVIGIAMKLNESSGQTSTVSGRTERADNSTTSGTGHIIEACDVVQVAPGTTPACTVTWSVTTSARALAVSIGFAAPMPTPSDTGLTVTDSIASHTPHISRSISDTGVSITDSIAAGKVNSRTVADTGLTVTTSLARAVTRPSVADAAFTSGLGSSTFVLDSFVRADENPLSDGGLWTDSAFFVQTNLALVSNQVTTAVSTANQSAASYIAGTSYADCVAFVTLPVVNSAASQVGLLLRWTDSASPTGYFIERVGQSWTVNRYVSGVVTTLLTVGSQGNAVAGDTIAARVVGTRIEMWLRPSGGAWKLIGAVTDSAIASGNIGLFGGNIGVSAQPVFSNFGGGAAASLWDSISAIKPFGVALSDVGLGGPALLDSFATGLSPNWSGPMFPGGGSMVSDGSGHAVGQGNADDASWWAASQFGPDCAGSMTLVTVPVSGSGNFASMFARVANPGTGTLDAYWFGFKNSTFSNDTFYIGKIVNGAFTTFVTAGAGSDLTNGDTVGFSIVGSTLSILHNGVVVTSTTDSTYTSAGYVGFGDNFGTGVYDNVIAGNISGVTDSISAIKTGGGVTITDTGLAVTDAVASLRLRPITDTGLTVSDSTQKSNRALISDTGLAITDSTTTSRNRAVTDAGLTISDSTTKIVRKALSDTGVTITESVATTRARAISDTGLTSSDSLQKSASKTLTDTGLAVSDSLTPTKTRSLTDTGLSVADTTQKTVRKSFSDTGVTVTDVISTGGSIAILDTGLSIAASVFAHVSRSLTDTGLIVAATLVTDRVRNVTATGLTVTDSLQKAASKSLTDTGAAVTDALVTDRVRQLADTGLSVTDATALHIIRAVTATGLTVTDAISVGGSPHLTDIGVLISESIQKSVSKSLADTGLAISDTLATTRTRTLTATGLTLTDRIGPAADRLLADTGLTVSDALQKHATHVLTDTGLVLSDHLARGGVASLTDTGLTVTESISKHATHFLIDTGVTISDAVSASTSGQVSIADQGLTITDSTASLRARFIVDTGATVADSLASHFVPGSIQLTDQGLTFSDTLVRSHAALSVFITDTGLTISDSLPSPTLPGFTTSTVVPAFDGQILVAVVGAGSGLDVVVTSATDSTVVATGGTDSDVLADGGAIIDQPGGLV